MISSALRWVGGGLLLLFILWAVFAVSQCKDSLREEGRQEVTGAIQQESLEVYKQEKDRTDAVMVEREQHRARHEATSTQAQKEIHQAPKATKATDIDIDRPLPDSIVSPLLMQYQAITHCQSGEDAPACGLDDGAGHSGTAQGRDGAHAGSLDK